MAKQMDKVDSSAIVDMEVIAGDESDYEADFNSTLNTSDANSKGGSGYDDFQGQMAQKVTKYVWNEGAEKAKKAFSLYANIDILRPYFDVEPHEVRTRLLQSVFPRLPPAGSHPIKVPRELYGPTMVVFTLIALLLFQMKASGHSVQEGTLMGTAFAISFGYWLGIGSLLWVLAYVCSTHINMLQILHLLGYGLFGHCLVLFFNTVWHSSSHSTFYLMWALIGGLSTLKMISVLVSRTIGRSQRLIICSILAVIHLLFLLYLHFAFHQIVEELSAAIDSPVKPAFHENVGGLPKKESMEKMVEAGASPTQAIIKPPQAVHLEPHDNFPKGPSHGLLINNQDIDVVQRPGQLGGSQVEQEDQKDAQVQGDPAIQGDPALQGGQAIQGDPPIQGDPLVQGNPQIQGNPQVEGNPHIQGNPQIQAEDLVQNQDLINTGDQRVQQGIPVNPMDGQGHLAGDAGQNEEGVAGLVPNVGQQRPPVLNQLRQLPLPGNSNADNQPVIPPQVPVAYQQQQPQQEQQQQQQQPQVGGLVGSNLLRRQAIMRDNLRG